MKTCQLLLTACVFGIAALCPAQEPRKQGVPGLAAAGQGLTEVHVLRGHRGAAFGVAVTPDGRRALTTGIDGTFRTWDLATGKELSVIQAHKDWAVGLDLSSDGLLAVTSGNDKSVRLWDLKTGTQRHRFEGHGNHVWTVMFSKDAKRVLSGSHDKTVRLWDVASGKEIRRFEGDAPVWGAALSPDGKRVLAPNKGAVRILNAETGETLAALKAPSAVTVAFSRDGRRALSGHKSAILWDVQSGRQLQKLEGHAKLTRFVAFSPDGRWAATTGYDMTVRLWELETGRESARFDWPAGKRYMLFGVAFTPDGRNVVAAGSDGLVRVLAISGPGEKN